MGLACVVASYRRFAEMRRLSRSDGAALAGLRRLESLTQLAALRERLSPQSPVGELLGELPGAPSKEHGVALINEASHDVVHVLDDRARIPQTAARVALATATLSALVVVAESLGERRPAVSMAVAAFFGGLVAALVCGMLARGAEQRRRELREQYGRLFDTAARLLRDGKGA